MLRHPPPFPKSNKLIVFRKVGRNPYWFLRDFWQVFAENLAKCSRIVGQFFCSCHAVRTDRAHSKPPLSGVWLLVPRNAGCQCLVYLSGVEALR